MSVAGLRDIRTGQHQLLFLLSVARKDHYLAEGLWSYAVKRGQCLRGPSCTGAQDSVDAT